MLTTRQREVLNLLKAAHGSFLVPYLNPRGSRYYRLLTADRSPVKNFRRGVVERMLGREYLEKKPEGIFSKA